jgi:hypothetical protein
MSQLWIPILLSAIAVFIASSLIHMVSPWHKGDYPRLRNEVEVMDAMRPLALEPGDYFFPRPDNAAHMRSSEFIARMAAGPNVLMTVFPNGSPAMGRTFVEWFVYLVVVSALAAHVVSRAVPAHGDRAHVFHQVALVSFAAYGLALWQLTIWYRRSRAITIKSTIDAVIYAAITAGIFAWWWPA